MAKARIGKKICDLHLKDQDRPIKTDEEADIILEYHKRKLDED